MSSRPSDNLAVGWDRLHISLDRGSGIALYRQIADAIRSKIESDEFRPGLRLPSSRAIAGRLRVHRRTVLQAFHMLEEGGWVTSGVGQGTFVGMGPDPAHSSDRDSVDLPSPRFVPTIDSGANFPWTTVLADVPDSGDQLWNMWLANRPPRDVIRFTGATPDPEHFPADEFLDVLKEVFQTAGSDALDYAPAAGHPPLREWISERLRGRGIEIGADQVVIVNGSQQGLDLIGRALIRPGQRVFVEEPSYSNGFRLFKAHGAEVTGIPLDEGGIELDALEQACSSGGGRLLYTMPNFQNPTGRTLDPGRIEPLLDICSRYGVPILEDHFDADLYYEGEAPAPILSKDRREQVVHLGTFSKILFPGLRLGWLVLPRALVRRILDLKQMTDLSTGLLAQQAIDVYCRRGLLDQHLEKIRKINGDRLRVLLDAMEAHLPEGCRWTRPRGGMTTWLQLPRGCDSLDLLRSSQSAGVDFSPGPFFFPNGGGSEFLRLSWIRETEERIREGIEILGAEIVKQVGRTGDGVSRPFL